MRDSALTCASGMAGFQRGTRQLTLVSLVALMAALGQGVAHGEDFKEPPRKFIDPLGIDVASGEWTRDDTFLSMGDLTWTFHARSPLASGDFFGHIGDSCTNPPPIFSEPSCSDDPSTLVWIGQSATTFEPGAGGTFVNYSGTAATLTVGSGSLIYTDDNGAIHTFTSLTAPGGAGGSGYYLTSIKHPNGLLITLNGGFTCNTQGVPYCTYDTVSAVTNTGYALRFTNGVEAINLMARTCDAQGQGTSCTAESAISIVATSDADLLGAGGVKQVTDAMNNVWKYKIGPRYTYTDPVSNEIVKGARTLWSFKDPTGLLIRTERQTRGGLTKMTIGSAALPAFQYFTYAGQGTYAEPNDNYDNVTKDSSAATMYTAKMNTGNGIMDYYKDGLNRQTTYSTASYQFGVSAISGQPIGQYSRLVSVTKPEGDYVTYSYNSRGNVTSAVKTGKSGSGITLTFTANFPSTCTYAVTCNKPVYTQDAKGYQTDYTYSTTHGGVLTVTLPADQNNLRQRTYNTYTADTFGTNTLYRLTKTETCGLSSTQLSLTACPTVSSTSVTNTTYFSHTFQPATVTQTDGAGSLSSTVTYAYDVFGHVTITDGPLSGINDQTIKTYDLAGRVVYEIGVDPDGPGDSTCISPGTGAGCLRRSMVHHIYDAAGRETKTEYGYKNVRTVDPADFIDWFQRDTSSPMFANSNNTKAGTDFVVTSFKRMTYDTAKRLVRTEEVQP